MTDEGVCRSVQLEAIRKSWSIVDDVCGTDREIDWIQVDRLH